MLAAAIAAITITTAFESGSIGRVERVGPDHLRCAVKGQADSAGRNRQANWYYFRLDNLPQREVRIDLVDLIGEYNFRPGAHAVTKNTRPVFSYDNRRWTHFRDEETSWDEKEVRLTVRFRPARRRMWVAHTVPYTQRDLEAALSEGGESLTRETIGKSVQGRDIALATITDRTAAEAGKRVVWLIARQHAWETGTSWTADGLVRFLLSDEPEAAAIRRTTIFKILPMFDPDGVAEGAVRFNANGYDNNRNWDAVDAERMPEIAAVRRSIFAWLDAGHRIDIVLALHNTESTDYLEGPLKGGGPRVQALAQDLVERLQATTSFYDPRSPRDSFGIEPIARGRMTVDQDLFAERGLAAFLMELMVERHPRLGRPRTAGDFAAFGRRLARCLAGTDVRGGPITP